MAGTELFRHSLFNSANLISYWRLDGNSTDAKDSNNGTDTAITYSAANGKFGQGAGFNGTSSFIAIADAANLDITGELTIHCWVNLNGVATTGEIVLSKGDNNSFAALTYTINVGASADGKPRGAISGGATGNTVDAATSIKNSTWHQVDVVYVPSTRLSIYIDGKLDGENTTSIQASIQSTTQAMAIGRDGDTASRFIPSGVTIDEVALFNRALTASEISSLYSTRTSSNLGLLNVG